MKQEFSNKWIGSKQIRKQRKYRENSPLHIKHKLIAASLSKALKEKYKKNSFPVRKGDTVKVLSGKFADKKGKIEKVLLKRLKVTVESLQIGKKDGTKISVYFPTSKLQIEEMNLDDKKRLDALNRKVKEKNHAPEKK